MRLGITMFGSFVSITDLFDQLPGHLSHQLAGVAAGLRSKRHRREKSTSEPGTRSQSDRQH